MAERTYPQDDVAAVGFDVGFRHFPFVLDEQTRAVFVWAIWRLGETHRGVRGGSPVPASAR